MTDFSTPPIDWTALAPSLGVSAVRVTTTDELRTALARALAEPQPHVIEVSM